MIETKPIENFKYGVINSLLAKTIPRGSASDSLNWLTRGDRMELRRGFKFLGDSSLNTGVGRATGIKKTTNALGVEILWGTYASKLKYFDRTTEEWIENGTDLLGTAANDEDISLEEYVCPAGNQLWVNSPNCAGLFKIMIANPTGSADQYVAGTNYKGHIRIDTSRMLLFLRTADATGIYGSYVDTQGYTTVTAEAIGAAGSKTYTGTLAFKTAGARRTCFAITFTDGTETFSDNYNGTLTGTLGGTGTINYMTGAYSISFNGVAVGSVTSTYQWEDSTADGIADFGKSTPRTAGQGFYFSQAEGGGDIKTIHSYKDVYYCFHLKKTWALTITATDTNASNLPYREKVGIPNLRAAVSTGEGIYFIDDSDKNDTKARLLTYDTSGSQQVIPIAISNNLDLNDYYFNKAVAYEWGNYLLFACRYKEPSSGTKNNRTLVYSKLWKSWDILDYAVSCFETYDGALMAGDSMTSNFMELFSGFDDDDSSIPNYWISNEDDLDIEGLKKTKKFKIAGEIGPEQKLKVSISTDGGGFVEVGGSDNDGVHTYAIEGSGDYVDKGQKINVGAVTLGKKEVGGGSEGVTAYYYEKLFSLGLDKFESISVQVEAVGLGYASFSLLNFWDIRRKSIKVPAKYREN